MTAEDAHRHGKSLSPQPTAEAAETIQDVAQVGMAVMEGAQGWVQVEVGGGVVLVGGALVVVVVGVGSGSMMEEEEDSTAEEEEEGGGHCFRRQVHPWLAGLLNAA